MLTILALTVVAAQSPPAVQLKHIYVKGMRSAYSVDANLEIEARAGILATFLPHDLEFKYNFYTNTVGVNGGVASIRYDRPSITEISGATPDSDPVPHTEVLNLRGLLQLSAINEILDYQDQTPKKGKAAAASDEVGIEIRSMSDSPEQERADEFVAPFIQDMERLSVFIGGFDGSLDLEPRFSLDAVKVGDSWKRTVSYQPQKLASKAGKTVNQRLDLTYTYKGSMQSRGHIIQRVHGEIKLDTDLAKYVNDLFDATPERTGLKAIPTKLTIEMDFDLDPKTFQTLYATTKSDGSFKVFGTTGQDAEVEQNIHGTSVMKLLSNKTLSEPAQKH